METARVAFSRSDLATFPDGLTHGVSGSGSLPLPSTALAVAQILEAGVRGSSVAT